MGMSDGKITYSMVDVGKFLCSLLILFYHYFSEHGPLPGILDEALSLYAVAVALFMIISGFLTFNKLEGLDRVEERWKYVKKQILRILKIYLLWSIIYIVFQISEWDYSELSFSFVFWKIQKWVFGSTYYTIWFMPSLAFGLLLAFWMTEKLPKWLSTILAVGLYILGSLTLTYSFVGDLIPGFSAFSDFAGKWLGGSRGWLFFGAPLVLLGKFMVGYKNKFSWKSSSLLSIASIVALLAEALILRKNVGNTGIDMTVMMIPASFFILSFLLSVKLPSHACFTWMRKMSVLIFMTQRIFLTVIPAILPTNIHDAVFANNYVGAVYLCGGTILFSALIIMLSNKVKWLKNLY